MYTYISSIARYKNSNRAWQNVNLLNVKVSDIIRDYQDVWFTFEHSSLQGTRYASLNDLLTASFNRSLTLDLALSAIGSRVFPTTTTAKTLISKSATWADALQAEWTWKTFKPGTHPDTPALISQKHDLYLRKDIVDMQDAADSLICFVNGMAHHTQLGYDGLVVWDGARTMRQTNNHLVNFLNLGQLGKTSCVMVDETNLKPGLVLTKNETEDGYISLGQDLTGKSVIMSIGGILFYEGKILQVVNRAAGVVRLNYHFMDHPVFYYDIAAYINPDNLGTLMDNLRANLLLKSAVYDADNLKAVFNMPQTFAIVVEAENVVVDYYPVADAQLKNVLVSPEYKARPFISYSGRLLPSNFSEDGGRFAYHVDRVQKPNFTHWTQTQWGTDEILTIGTAYQDPFALSEHNMFIDIKTQWFE